MLALLRRLLEYHTYNLCTDDACFCIFCRKDRWRYRIGLAPFCHDLITWPVYKVGLVPWRMQALQGGTLLDEEQARDIRRGFAIEHHGDSSGVPALDETGFFETGFLKKGSRCGLCYGDLERPRFDSDR